MYKQRSWVLFTSSAILRSLSYVGVLTILTGTWGIVFPIEGTRAFPSTPSISLWSSTSARLLAQSSASSLLQFGSEGPEVQAIQTFLQLLGYYSGQIDGRYQESTVIAVSAFQNAAGLSEDGIVGPTTWEKLLPSVSQVSSNSSSVTSSVVSTSPPSNEANSPSNSSGSPSPPQSSDSGTNGSASAVESGTEETDSVIVGSPISSASEDIRLPTLRLGMRGPAVRNLQERLSSLGLLQGTVDGVFGSQTEESVKSAQRYFNLTADGVVGAATWRALLQ